MKHLRVRCARHISRHRRSNFKLIRARVHACDFHPSSESSVISVQNSRDFHARASKWKCAPGASQISIYRINARGKWRASRLIKSPVNNYELSLSQQTINQAGRDKLRIAARGLSRRVLIPAGFSQGNRSRALMIAIRLTLREMPSETSLSDVASGLAGN